MLSAAIRSTVLGLASCSGARKRNAASPLSTARQASLLLGGAVRGVDRDGAARPRRFPQPVQLVLLQGDQRGHDDGGPLLPAVQQEGGDLVDGRLPVAGGHDGEDVPAGGEGAHPGELAFAEVRQAKGDVREVAEVGVVVHWMVEGWKLGRRTLEGAGASGRDASALAAMASVMIAAPLRQFEVRRGGHGAGR